MKEYGKYEVKPVPMGIDRVEGQVPVPGGMLQVKVEKDTVNFKEL